MTRNVSRERNTHSGAWHNNVFLPRKMSDSATMKTDAEAIAVQSIDSYRMNTNEFQCYARMLIKNRVEPCFFQYAFNEGALNVMEIISTLERLYEGQPKTTSWRRSNFTIVNADLSRFRPQTFVLADQNMKMFVHFHDCAYKLTSDFTNFNSNATFSKDDFDGNDPTLDVPISIYGREDDDISEERIAVDDELFFLSCRYFEVFFDPSEMELVGNFREAITKQPCIVESCEKTDPTINVVSWQMHRGFYLRDISMKTWPRSNSADLHLHYGEAFPLFHSTLIDKMRTTNRGIALFYGEPGSGKTFYIRRLTSDLCQMGKTVVLVPRAIVEKIQSDPSFTEFMISQFHDGLGADKGAVLLVEDAESILQSRENNQDSAACVSTLLNMTDGILNDMFNIQVIATFNMAIEKIDAAVLRPGRMIARRQFGRLSIDDGRRLAVHLKLDPAIITSEMLISEIYELSSTVGASASILGIM